MPEFSGFGGINPSFRLRCNHRQRAGWIRYIGGLSYGVELEKKARWSVVQRAMLIVLIVRWANQGE